MKYFSIGIFQLFRVHQGTKIVEILQYYNISIFPTTIPGKTRQTDETVRRKEGGGGRLTGQDRPTGWALCRMEISK